MPWVLIILIVVVAIGLFGFLSSKVDELSGIGREHTAGSFRWPHGKVVRTRILSAEKEHERGEIAKKVLLPCIVIAAVCAVLTMFGPVVSYGNVLTVVSLLASLVIATLVCGKSDAGRAFCYAVVGLGIACTVLILITRAYVSVSTAEVNAFTATSGPWVPRWGLRSFLRASPLPASSPTRPSVACASLSVRRRLRFCSICRTRNGKSPST